MSITLNELKKLVKETYLQEVRNPYDRVVKALKGARGSINSIGIMTAQNPNGVKAPEEENKKINEEFVKDLRDKGYGYYHIGGRFEGVDEDSFVINNIDKKTLLSFAVKYNQASVIYGERISDDEFLFYYLDSSSGESPTDPVSMVLTHPNPEVTSRKDMYSSVNKGKAMKKFVIPFFEDGYAHKKQV